MKRRWLSLLLAACVALAPAVTYASDAQHPGGGAETIIISGETTPTDGETTPGEGQVHCTCHTLCTEGMMNPDCPVCGAEGADLSACQGEAPAMLAMAAPLANEATVYVGSATLTSTDGSTVYATMDDGKVTLIENTTPEPSPWNISWDGETLTLKDANIQGEHTFTNALAKKSQRLAAGTSKAAGYAGGS